MNNFGENIDSAKKFLTVAVCVTASAILVQNLRVLISNKLYKLFNNFSSETTTEFDEFGIDGVNHIFEAVNIYLSKKISHSKQRNIVHRPVNDKEMAATIDLGVVAQTRFQGEFFYWRLVCERGGVVTANSSTRFDRRYFEVSFKKENKDLLIQSFLPVILEVARKTREKRNMVKLRRIDYNCTYYWSSINLESPLKFDSIAMDEDMKARFIKDLERFRNGSDYYMRVKKAWKRTYLVYGPLGTGKSSLVDAMANHINCDLYHIFLKDVHSYSELGRCLLGVREESILMIEDIRSSVELQNRESKSNDSRVTLSGVVNTIDGFFSRCGDGRIIVIKTSKDKDNLDQELLRPGLIDMDIQMSYCTFSGFKTLAKNYLNTEAHELFQNIENLLNDTEVTPSEVARELMKYDAADLALKGLVELLSNLHVD